MGLTLRFALNFSGSGVFEQHAAATHTLQSTAASDHAARARLFAIIAATRVFSHPAEALEANARCLEASQCAGDEVSRAWAMVAECVVDVSCATTERRRALTGEVLEIAERCGETEFVEFAFFLHLAALAELGLMTELDRGLSPVGRFLASFPWLASGRHVTWFRCLQATLDGRAADAEQLAYAGLALAQESADPDAQAVFVGQLGIIRWMQGRVVELEPAFLEARQSAPHEPVWAVSLAWIWLRQGRKSAARALISSLPPLAALPLDRNWLSTACIMAEVVSELADVARARDLLEGLLPFADRVVTVGLGVTCWGTVARALALLAAATGDAEAAVAHYRQAIEVAARTGAHPWLAECQWELATLLSRRAAPGDREEAVELAAEALATGRALQLPGVERAAAEVLTTVQSADRPAPPGDGSLPGVSSETSAVASPAPTSQASGVSAGAGSPRTALAHSGTKPRIDVLGDFSVTSACGVVAEWQSRKARQLLKALVARRGTAIRRETLMDWLWPDEAPELLANRFSVATTVLRRALDPTASHPRDAFIVHRDGLMRLRLDTIDIDVERFLRESHVALRMPAADPSHVERLRHALALYTGDPLPDEQEEVWATELRREVHAAFFSLSHALAERSADAGDHLTRLETYRRVLELDEYDQRAHEGLIDALGQLGSHGQAAIARDEYVARMAALGIPL